MLVVEIIWCSICRYWLLSQRSRCLFCINLILFLSVFFLENQSWSRLVSFCALYSTSSCWMNRNWVPPSFFELASPFLPSNSYIVVEIHSRDSSWDSIFWSSYPLLGICSSFSHKRTMLTHKNLKEFDEVVVVVVAVVVVVVIVDHYHHTPYHRSPYRRHHRRRHYYY